MSFITAAAALTFLFSWLLGFFLLGEGTLGVLRKTAGMDPALEVVAGSCSLVAGAIFFLASKGLAESDPHGLANARKAASIGIPFLVAVEVIMISRVLIAFANLVVLAFAVLVPLIANVPSVERHFAISKIVHDKASNDLSWRKFEWEMRKRQP